MEQEQKKKRKIRRNEFALSTKELREEVLTMTRVGVYNLGRYSCTILVGFMFLRHDEEISEIFRRVRACVEERIDPRRHSLVVLDRVFAVVQAAERAFRHRREPDSYTMKLKGVAEGGRKRVFAGEEDSYVWSFVDGLCGEIFFMEELVNLVMSREVGVTAVDGHIRECLDSLDSVSLLIDRTPSKNGEDYLECVRIETMTAERTAEIWSNFELYHQPFTTL